MDVSQSSEDNLLPSIKLILKPVAQDAKKTDDDNQGKNLIIQINGTLYLAKSVLTHRFLNSQDFYTKISNISVKTVSKLRASQMSMSFAKSVGRP